MKNLEELRRIRDEVRKNMDLRGGEKRAKIVVCMGTCGIAAGARDTMKAFMDALEKAGVGDVALTAAGCAGFCEKEPMVEVEIAGAAPMRYGHVNAAAAQRIVKEHILGGQVVQDLRFG
jgi:NADP-reducing hydrogenase subunit HndB